MSAEVCPCGCGVPLDALRPPHANADRMRRAIGEEARTRAWVATWTCLWCGKPTPGRFYCSDGCRTLSLDRERKNRART